MSEIARLVQEIAADTSALLRGAERSRRVLDRLGVAVDDESSKPVPIEELATEIGAPTARLVMALGPGNPGIIAGWNATGPGAARSALGCDCSAVAMAAMDEADALVRALRINDAEDN